MKNLCLTLCAFLLTTLWAAAEKPNVVIIFIDDMGYGDVGFNGATGPKTPNLAEGFPEVIERLQKAYTEHVAEINAHKRPAADLMRAKDALDPERPGPPKKTTKKRAKK